MQGVETGGGDGSETGSETEEEEGKTSTTGIRASQTQTSVTKL